MKAVDREVKSCPSITSWKQSTYDAGNNNNTHIEFNSLLKYTSITIETDISSD